jgi:hypothetical protein
VLQRNAPGGIAIDARGNIYIADPDDHYVFVFKGTGETTVVAGSGKQGWSGDGGPATSARLSFPEGVAIDAAGNLYISDHGNGRIRRVTAGGVIDTVAGTGKWGFSGDGASAKSARLNGPQGLAVDAKGNLFIADLFNGRVRKVSPDGIINTVVGNGTIGSRGDGGSALLAQLDSPYGLALDDRDNLYVTEVGGKRVRRITPDGVISTIAGNGELGSTGDGGPAIKARLGGPLSPAFDAAGNLYIAEVRNHRVRKITPKGMITTIAGNGTKGFSGDGGLALYASLTDPEGVVADRVGNVYIVEAMNSRIRKVTPDGRIDTVLSR